MDSKGNYGYNIMVGNGTGAKPENDKFKWFYGDIFAKFLDQKLIFDLYADYERLNWTSSFHHSRNMVKGFVSYTTQAYTIGIEAFINRGKNDVVAMNTGLQDTTSATAQAISFYIKGRIIKDKLYFFVRMDNYNPDTKYDNSHYRTYKGLTSTYEPNNKEMFISAGLDFTPVKNVHFMPNIWYNRYMGQQSSLIGSAFSDHDLVFRLTFYYLYR